MRGCFCTAVLGRIGACITKGGDCKLQNPMGVRARRYAGVLLCLIGVSSFFFFLRVFWRIGLWQALEGPKGAIYTWLLTVSGILPLTVGIALMLGRRSWRPFVGWWLVSAGFLVLGSLLWFVPEYRIWPDLIVCGAVAGPPPIVCGLVLILRSSGRKAVPVSDEHTTEEQQAGGNGEQE